MAPTTIVSDSWSTPSWASSNICSTKAGHTNPCVLRSSGETFTPGTFQGLPMVGSPQPPTLLPIPLRQGIPWSMGMVYGPTYSMGCCGGGSLWGSMGWNTGDFSPIHSASFVSFPKHQVREFHPSAPTSQRPRSRISTPPRKPGGWNDLSWPLRSQAAQQKKNFTSTWRFTKSSFRTLRLSIFPLSAWGFLLFFFINAGGLCRCDLFF